jgi:hypothetical protein
LEQKTRGVKVFAKDLVELEPGSNHYAGSLEIHDVQVGGGSFLSAQISSCPAAFIVFVICFFH